MKVVIVGGTSSIGISLKPALENFCEVITAGRSGCDIHFDLQDDVSRMIFPEDTDVLIHLAAHLGGKTNEEMEAAERLNVLGTLKLCQAAVQANVKHFIFVSSIFSLLPETSPFSTIYAISKRHAEEVIRYYLSDKAMTLTVLRPSQIYGSSERFRQNQPFFYQIIDKAERGEDILFYGSHDAQRNYLHIDDLVKIIAEVAQSPVEGSFNCASLQNVTYSQIAQAAIEAFGSRSAIRFLSEKPDIPDNIFDQDNTLYEKIGFSPKISIEEGMIKIATDRKGVS